MKGLKQTAVQNLSSLAALRRRPRLRLRRRSPRASRTTTDPEGSIARLRKRRTWGCWAHARNIRQLAARILNVAWARRRPHTFSDACRTLSLQEVARKYLKTYADQGRTAGFRQAEARQQDAPAIGVKVCCFRTKECIAMHGTIPRGAAGRPGRGGRGAAPTTATQAKSAQGQGRPPRAYSYSYSL